MRKLINNKQAEAGLALLDIIAILALIVSAGAIGYTYMNHAEAGPRGLQGTPGVNGTQGIMGAQGEQGPIGPTGATGIQGIPGVNGTTFTDHKPVINITSLTGHYSADIINLTIVYHYIYNIGVKINDSDNDTVQTTISYRRNTTDQWKPILTYTGQNHTLTATTNYTRNTSGSQVLDWQITSWDGMKLTTKETSYLIIYP